MLQAAGFGQELQFANELRLPLAASFPTRAFHREEVSKCCLLTYFAAANSSRGPDWWVTDFSETRAGGERTAGLRIEKTVLRPQTCHLSSSNQTNLIGCGHKSPKSQLIEIPWSPLVKLTRSEVWVSVTSKEHTAWPLFQR